MVRVDNKTRDFSSVQALYIYCYLIPFQNRRDAHPSE